MINEYDREKKSKLKLIIGGNARHGKDTLAEILRDRYGLIFDSSSNFANEKVIFPVLSKKYGYKTLKECDDDMRYGVNSTELRAEWFQLIQDYTKEDKTKLTREIFEMNDIYVGIRCNLELKAAIDSKLTNLTVYVDASNRLPKESNTSNTINKDLFDIVIENNGTEEEFKNKIINIFDLILNTKKLENVISEDSFVEIMGKLYEQYLHDRECIEAFEIILPDNWVSGYNNSRIFTGCINLLESICEDTVEKWIDYYIHDLQYGENYIEGFVREADGTNIPLKTFTDLYNLLKNNYNNDNNNRI